MKRLSPHHLVAIPLTLLIAPAEVHAIRRTTADRRLPRTAPDLLALADDSPVPTPTTSAADAPIITPDPSGQLHLPASKTATLGRALPYRPTLDVLALRLLPAG